VIGSAVSAERANLEFLNLCTHAFDCLTAYVTWYFIIAKVSVSIDGVSLFKE